MFTEVGGATAAVAEIGAPGGSGLPTLRDAAMMAWEQGSHRPGLHAAEGLRKCVPMGAGFWNLLFSHLFFLPMAAAEAGVSAQAWTGSLSGLGIRNDFLDTAGRRLTPGTSALFLLTDDATVDRVLALLPNVPYTVTSTNLSTRQLEALRRAFGPYPARAVGETA